MGHIWGGYCANDGPVDVYAMVDTCGDGCYTVLLHQAGCVRGPNGLRAKAPGSYILVRAHTDGDWYAKNPEEWAQHCWDALMSNGLVDLIDAFTWANEQNLALESAGKIGATPSRLATWHDYQEIAGWNLRVIKKLRELRGDRKLVLHYPAMAMGHGEDWGYDDGHNPLPGFPLGANGVPVPAFELLRGGIGLCDVLNVHPYRVDGAPVLDEWKGVKRIEKTRALFPDTPLFVDETGDFQVWDDGSPGRLITIGYYFQGLGYVYGVTPFIWHSPDKAHAANDWSLNPKIADAWRRSTRVQHARPTRRSSTASAPTASPHVNDEGIRPAPIGQGMHKAEAVLGSLGAYEYHVGPEAVHACYASNMCGWAAWSSSQNEMVVYDYRNKALYRDGGNQPIAGGRLVRVA